MKEDLMEKLWRLQCLMAEIEAKSNDVAERIGFKDMHHVVYDYIRGVEYDNAMQAFRRLSPEMKEKLLVNARQIYEGETE